MTSLKVGAANEIDRAQSGGNGPANVYAKKFGFRDFTGVALDKIQPPQTNPQPAIKQSGAIESQRAGCFAGRTLGMPRSPIFFAGAEIVFIKRFRIIQATCFDGLRQTTMDLLSLYVFEQRGQRLADAIMIKLDA